MRRVIVILLLVSGSAAARDRGLGYIHSLRPDKGYGSPASLQSLRELHGLGADSISLTPFGFQHSSQDTTILWVGNHGRGIGETDLSIREAAGQAHSLHLRVMLKPHIWLRPPGWPGSIDPDSRAGWEAWFRSYEEFILHYARLAEEIQAETFCIGNELSIADRHEQDWRTLIRKIRGLYHGRLTYGANFDEVFNVPFWDAVDVIGISAYFPLSDALAPDTATLVRAWKPIVSRLARLSARWKRPILFTEIGYSSRDGTAKHPWEERGGNLNLSAQAAAYEAFFQAVWPQPWLSGVYFWKWESFPQHDDGRAIAFTMENKPAAAVLRKYFEASVGGTR